MHFDPLTLMVPGAFAMALAGVILCCAYYHWREQVALLWWSVASVVEASGLAVLITGLAADKAAVIATGVAITTVAPALYWGGIRRFNDRRTPIVLLATGLVTWIAAGALAQAAQLDPQLWTTAASFALWIAYCAACIRELWSTRAAKLAYRWPLIGFLSLHVIVYLGGFYDVLTGVLALDRAPSLFSWFGLVHFETIIFAMGGTTALLLMIRERVEQVDIAAANIDPLTGTANRRTFFERAERLHQRCKVSKSPLLVVMFDLDYFKNVNDTLGHKAGDQVIMGFAKVTRSFLRANDIFGRYGGEEFVLVLPDISMDAGVAIANRARLAFARAFSFLDGYPINATVSAGIAMAAPDETFDATIMAADTAMYAAKNAGRNRVMRADGAAPPPSDNIVRIA